MLVLGLGSNIGDRLSHLRKALAAIKNLPNITVQQVSPVYMSNALLPENAPVDWDKPYLNVALRCETTLTPLDLLDQLKNIEWSIGRKPEIRHWGPRIVDIDILAWENVVIESERLTVPHLSLQERPFALWPLADVAPFWKFPLSGANAGKTAAQMVEAWGSRFSGEAPFQTRQINHRIDTPQLMGIVNITPDSFSDGGLCLHAEKAITHVSHLIESGAEIIDLGAESTAPNAIALDPETEWERLEPVLHLIHQHKNNFLLMPKISLDTRHVHVAKRALELGIDWINDVSGLDDPAMREVVMQSKTDCVVMHHLSLPENRNHLLPRDQDPVALVYAWGDARINELVKLGIPRGKIIFDPGIGFGKMAEQSLCLLQHANVFRQLGTRVLIGHSRKTFLSLMSGRSFEERDLETMVMALHLAKQSVDYIRVHNVEWCARGFRVMSAVAD